MPSMLFIVNDAPYGNERAYNAFVAKQKPVFEGD